MSRDLYAQSTAVVYRVYDLVENKFCSTGRSLYAGNGRSIWANKSGASNAMRHMPDKLKHRLVVKKFILVEIDTESK